MDRIIVRDLLVRCVLGVSEEERRDQQDVLINLAVGTDLQSNAARDRLDGLDYRKLKKSVLEGVAASRFHLLEALAEHVARICLDSPHVLEVQVTIDKPGALRFARSVAVEITRTRR